MANAKKTLQYLLISKVRIKALNYFFFHIDVPIHLRAAVREFKEEINAVRRELSRLEECNILKIERRGNRKYFSLNYKHPFFPEILAIFHKSFGLGGDIIRHHRKIGEIDFAIITNAFTKGIRMDTHDVDLVIIGNVDLEYLGKIITRVEKNLKREINYTVLKRTEFELRKKRKDSFVNNLMLGSKIFLIGTQEEFIS